jgi:hypothetical protein
LRAQSVRAARISPDQSSRHWVDRLLLAILHLSITSRRKPPRISAEVNVKHSRKQQRREKARGYRSIGPIWPLLIVEPLPCTLIEDAMSRFPKGRLSRAKIEMYIRHCLTNYDHVCYALRHQRYAEVRQVVSQKVATALDEWLCRFPAQAKRIPR